MTVDFSPFWTAVSESGKYIVEKRDLSKGMPWRGCPTCGRAFREIEDGDYATCCLADRLLHGKRRVWSASGKGAVDIRFLPPKEPIELFITPSEHKV